MFVQVDKRGLYRYAGVVFSETPLYAYLNRLVNSIRLRIELPEVDEGMI